jgi:general secretion pathway protein F
MEFTALTLTKDNRVASLSITARDEADARAQLARNGLFVSSLRARHSGLLQAASSHPGRDRRFNLVLFSQELLALLQAGLGANLSDKIRIGVDYSGLIGARNDDHGARATLNFAF